MRHPQPSRGTWPSQRAAAKLPDALARNAFQVRQRWKCTLPSTSRDAVIDPVEPSEATRSPDSANVAESIASLAIRGAFGGADPPARRTVVRVTPEAAGQPPQRGDEQQLGDQSDEVQLPGVRLRMVRSKEQRHRSVPLGREGPQDPGAASPGRHEI